MTKSHNTALNRVSSNVKQLGDLLSTELSSAQLHAVAIQLEGYSMIVKGYAMKAAEE
jgi:hypothetical protein